jgi:hypothetical protein
MRLMEEKNKIHQSIMKQPEDVVAEVVQKDQSQFKKKEYLLE